MTTSESREHQERGWLQALHETVDIGSSSYALSYENYVFDDDEYFKNGPGLQENEVSQDFSTATNRAYLPNHSSRERFSCPNAVGSRSKVKNQELFNFTVQMEQRTPRTTSNAISLPPSHISRTHSELQLCEDIAAAEWRDFCMFHRLVSGIREKQANRLYRRSTHMSMQGEDSDRRIEQSLENILRQRQEDLGMNSGDNLNYFDPSYVYPPKLSTCESDLEPIVIDPDDYNEEEMFIMDL